MMRGTELEYASVNHAKVRKCEISRQGNFTSPSKG